MENNCCVPSVAVELEQMLAATEPFDVREWPRWSKPSIYRVPRWLKRMIHTKDADEAYRPQLVSLGPFHHDDPDLRPMEEHKRRAVFHLAKRWRKPLRAFFAAIEAVADELMDAYHDLDRKWRREDRDRFLQIMVVDGCFLLEIMKGVALNKAHDDYLPSDPVFSTQGMLSLWVGIWSDMLMIENQVPLLALYRLEAVLHGRHDIISRAKFTKDINKVVLDFMCNPPLKGVKLAEASIEVPYLHPLDIFYKSFCGLSPPRGEKFSPELSVPSAVELRDAGILIKRSKTKSVNDIKFKNGVLSLPAISIHDGTKQVFLNLMAFERLHSDTAGTIATDYMIFMDNIIDSERDVALLRSKGVIKNLLSSDKEAANLYNILSRGAVMSPYSKLQEVRRQVNAHFKNRWNRWVAFFLYAHMRNPLVFISFIVAGILLISTLLQTIYTVWGFYEPK